MQLAGKVAIVTGATSGIGEAIARRFAAEGATVIIGGRKDEVGQQIVAEIKAAGQKALYSHLEVTEEADWEATVELAKEATGRLDILVNNAGTNAADSLPHVDLEQWNQIMAINVTGPLLGIQTCAPLMKETDGGSIVNISSLGGMLATPSTAYSTSKWALRGLSKNAAFTYADWGIRSNVIEPGFIGDTNMTKAILQNTKAKGGLGTTSLLGRDGEPSELAAAALFLASDDSSYLTGIDLPVDGGLSSAGAYGLVKAQLRAAIKQAEGK